MIQNILQKYVSLIGFTLLSLCSLAQKNPIPKKDIFDILFQGKIPVNSGKQDSVVQGKLYLTPLPILGYNPAYGFVIGGGSSANLLLGKRYNTQVSNAIMNLTLSSKKQVNLSLRTAIYTAGNEFILQGDTRILLFSQPTYGLGINFSNQPDSSGIDGVWISDSREQPMKFNYIRFYQSGYKRINGNWYAGAGLMMDMHYSIQDELLDTLSPQKTRTSHYQYSSRFGFNKDNYVALGLSANILHDSRDNIVNPQKGHYGSMSFRVNPKIMESDAYSSSLFYEYRTYFHLHKTKKLSPVLALWNFGQFKTGGKLPYLAMPSITWDMFNRSGRGYIQGRIRGESLWYAETEYRFPITNNGLLGAVLFVNTTTASNPMNGQQLFNQFATAYGGGLRIKMSKATNTNIAIDYGRGRNGSNGIYFNLQEVF